jgi:outer membrane receptor protein involved in Fe transport
MRATAAIGIVCFGVLLGPAAAPTAAQTPAPPSPVSPLNNDRRVEGTVVDAQGLPIVGAQITLVRPQANISKSATSSTDRFRFDGLAPGVYTLRVTATGFQMQQMSIDLRTDMARTIDLRLQPAGITEQMVVTATRSEQRVADVPASVDVVTSEQIQRSPAVVADDVLRQLPAFSLFRRTSSLASHPTAQGVSLRGIGPSGVSRTLVLLDEVPFNDPFGGWVYWTRVPMMDTDRIEVVEGAASSLYGNYAMGGVINILTNRAQPRTLIFKPQYGNRGTPKMDLFGSDVWGKLGATFNATKFSTDGYKIVAAEERGPIDNEAWVKYQTGSGKLDYNPSDRVNLFMRAGVFDENRSNGKSGVVPETNKTNWKYGNGGARVNLPDGSTLDGRLFVDRSHFYSTFLAVPAATPPRSQDNLTLEQNVPTDSVGTMVQWTRGFQIHGRSQVVTAGGDFRWIKGDSDEITYAAATGLMQLLHRVSGGRQKIGGAFAQDLMEITPKLQLTLSARLDRWHNYDAHNHETTMATGAPTANDKLLADRSDKAVSPRIAALYRATDKVSVWGSFSRGFRAPTLNELYRQFRVGAILTTANENLGPERLTGVEAGISVAPVDRLTIRGTLFNNRLTDPIANVTTTPNGNTRQRRNLGSTNIAGFQADAAYRVDAYWNVAFAYVFDNAKVHQSVPDAQNIDLTGKYLPEVPKHRASFQVGFTHPKFANLALDTEFIGMQFDDDQNLAAILPAIPDKKRVGLPAYSVTNLTVSRAVTRKVDLFFGAQNLFGKLYYVGTNPTTIGTPRLVNGGIKLRVGS